MKHSQSQAQKIRNYFAKHPDKTVSEVAKAMGLQYQTVYMTKRAMDKKMSELVFDVSKGRKHKSVPHIMIDMTQHADGSITEKVTKDWNTVHISTTNAPLPVTMEEPKSDPVNHPAHYKVGGIETIDFIEAKRLNYNMGNAVKYIARADHKGNRKQDLEKAVWYLQREISHTL
jgi:hypothetical protein